MKDDSRKLNIIWIYRDHNDVQKGIYGTWIYFDKPIYSEITRTYIYSGESSLKYMVLNAEYYKDKLNLGELRSLRYETSEVFVPGSFYLSKVAAVPRRLRDKYILPIW